MNSQQNEIDDVEALAMDRSLCSDLPSVRVLEPKEYYGGDGVSCGPFSNLNQIWTWRKENWANHVVRLAPRTAFVLPGNRASCTEGIQPRVHQDSVPKTLFCHDMRGGYLEDRFVNGTTRPNEYRFFHWAGVDTFVYFSHHLLTIPPLSWINSGHLHGVPVLGTMITEGPSGEKIWEELLADVTTLVRFADTLAVICRYYQFDGYLLNVENVVKETDIPNLVRFVTELRVSLRRLGLRHAQVLWYDSVTYKGKLEWQNELNKNNRCFFDACDGIFLNYTWSEDHLKRSLQSAGARCLDVYVGVDIFGRNCYGGGGFDSDKALSVIRSFGLSVALFAAGWTHECLDRRNFTLLEYLFWQKLWPYLYLHGPIKLPFSTTFCQGYGNHLFNNGQVHMNSPWCNLRKQQYQPCVPSALEQRKVVGSHIKNPDPKRATDALPAIEVAAGSGPACKKIKKADTEIPADYDDQGYVAHYSEDAFFGGGCLKVGGPGSYSLKRMLVCGFRSTGILVVSVASKVPSPVITLPALNLLLLVQNRDGCYSKHVLVGAEQGGEASYLHECAVQLHRPLSVREISQMRSAALEECTQKQLGIESSHRWDVRHYSLEVDGTVLEIGAEVSTPDHAVLLGWLAMSRLDGY